MRRGLAMVLAVSVGGCSMLAHDPHRVRMPGVCERHTGARVADTIVGTTLLAGATYAAYRPNTGEGADFLWTMGALMGTLGGMFFIGSSLLGREKARACDDERAELGPAHGYDTGLSAPPAQGDLRSQDVEVAPPEEPVDDEPPREDRSRENPPREDPPRGESPHEQPASARTTPLDGPWTEWLDDRDLASKLARASALSAARDACNAQHPGTTADPTRLDPSKLVCEQRNPGAMQWRCRYQAAAATCIE